MLEYLRAEVGDVARTQGKHHVATFRQRGNLARGFVERSRVTRGLAAARLDHGHYAFAGHAGKGRFAGWINIQDENAIRIAESGAEFFQQIARTGVAMGLENDVDAPEAALPRGGQSGADFRGMVSVIVNHAYSGSMPAQLEAAVHATEIFESLANE